MADIYPVAALPLHNVPLWRLRLHWPASRLDPLKQYVLRDLGRELGKPVTQLVDEAVDAYVAQHQDVIRRIYGLAPVLRVAETP